jgi:phosphate uptake regulator
MPLFIIFGGNSDMEYRKLIAFGKSSYVVSLPKSWVNQNKLKKGDHIYFDDSGGGLNLYPRSKDEGQQNKSVVIQIDGKSMHRIEREIISAYIHDNKRITLMGGAIKNKAKDIQTFMQKLVALEIVEQDSKKIIANDFLDLKQISLQQVIRKMDIISRSMLSDCKNMFEDQDYSSINHRDQDINKFRFLVYRLVWYGLDNPSAILRKLNLNQVDLFNYWAVSYDIEQIGDCIKRIAKFMTKVQLPEKGKKEFVKLLGEIERYYLQLLKAYYAGDHELAHTVTDARADLIRKCDDFSVQYKDGPAVGYLIYNTKGLIVNVGAIARTVYQGMLSKESPEN